MQPGRWAERWERRRSGRDAEAEALAQRRPLPSGVTAGLFLVFLVFVGALAWTQASPIFGVATAAIFAADYFVGIFRGKLWTTSGTTGTDHRSLAPRRSFMLTSGLFKVAVGVTMMLVSAARPGVLLGGLLAATGILGSVVLLVYPR